MTISQKRKDVPENVLLRQQQYQERLQQRYGYCINYLVYERPISNSPYIFLQTKAPFEPITTHSACWKILYNAFLEAGILKKGRICGTRLTRHNVASRMLRKGIPLTIISATLGHLDPNSVNIYLTTDEAKLAECTLPLPVTGGGLSLYDAKIRCLFPDRIYFFPNRYDQPYGCGTIAANFNRIWYKAFPDFNVTPKPRAYDFRHHFAWTNLNRWAQEGTDVNVMLPYLMRYMGHSHIKSTLYYFHFVPEFFGTFAEKTKSLESLLPEVPHEEG